MINIYWFISLAVYFHKHECNLLPLTSLIWPVGWPSCFTIKPGPSAVPSATEAVSKRLQGSRFMKKRVILLFTSWKLFDVCGSCWEVVGKGPSLWPKLISGSILIASTQYTMEYKRFKAIIFWGTWKESKRRALDFVLFARVKCYRRSVNSEYDDIALMKPWLLYSTTFNSARLDVEHGFEEAVTIVLYSSHWEQKAAVSCALKEWSWLYSS